MGKSSDQDKKATKQDEKVEREELKASKVDDKAKDDRGDYKGDHGSKKDDQEDRKDAKSDDKAKDDGGDKGHGKDDHDSGRGDSVDRSDAKSGQRINSGGGDDEITGSSKSDRINSGGGDDRIDAGAGDDRVNAGGGDDFVKGGAGNDKLYGNGGYDTAVYEGSIFDFGWAKGKGNSIIVEDRNKADGDEGRDLLKHFEALQFNDVTLKLDENNAALVQAEDAATDEDTGIDLSFKAFDFDCGKVSVESVTVSGGGSISLAGFSEIRAGMGKGAEFGLRFEPGDAYQYLNEGESVVETVTVVVSDGQGAYTTKTFEVTIEGRNDDEPVVVQPLDATVAYDADPATQEDGVTELTGQISSTGGVEGAEKSFSVVSGGLLGALTIAADGSFAYALDNASDAVQSLAEGETAIETFEIEVTDGEGNVDVVTVELTVSGTNDAPVISSAGAPATATEAAPTVSGQVAASDIDKGDELSYAIEGSEQGSYGSILMNAETGAWEFTANPDAQAFKALGAGETAVQQFVVEVSDGKGGTATDIIAIEIQGTNDGPVIDRVSYRSDAVVEDGVAVASGTIEASDADAGDTLAFSAEAPQGSYGSLDVDPETGEWAYTMDNAAAQALGVGQVVTESFVVSVTDAAGEVATSTVTVTVTGTNDAPIISATGTPSAPASEAAPTLSGSVSASDVDEGDVLAYAVDGPATGDYGSLALDATTGEWVFTVDPEAPAVQALGAGEIASQSFMISVSDGNGGTATKELVVQIAGGNSAPTLTAVSQDVAELTEDGVVAATGKVAGSDADAGDSLAYTASSGSYGTPVVDAEGNWSYELDNASDAIQSLGAGETLTESFDITVTDAEGATDTVTIELTITGTNDAPEITSVGEPTAPVSEEAPVITGQIAATDVDANDTLDYAVEGPAAGDYGSLMLDPATGAWSFSIDPDAPAVQALGAGETATQVFTITVSDGKGGVATQDLAIEITGSNAAPTLDVVSQDVSELVEDGVTIATGKVQGTDADAGDSLAYAAQGGAYGTPTVDADGNWSYALDNASDAIQSLGAGETLTETFVITVTDAEGATDTVTIELTITGTNDAPVVSSAGAPAAASEAQLVTTGQVAASDVDANDVLAYAVQDAANDYGSFAIDPITGEYEFTLDPNSPAVTALGAGEVATHDFTVEVSDGKGGVTPTTVTITIEGSNSAPVIDSVMKSGDAVEDVTTTVTGTVTASDADAGDSLAFAIASNGSYGSAAIDATGAWSYELANASPVVQALGVGETLTETFVVSVTDANGAEVTETIEITITGTNDAPEVVDAGTGEASEAAQVVTGQIVATDIDANDTVAFAADNGGAGTYGSLAVDPATGEWTFTLDPDAPAVLALGAGEQAVEEFTVTVSDGNGGTTTAIIPVTITGSNGDPVIQGVNYDAGPSLVEDGESVASGQVVASDPDAGDSLTFAVQGGGKGAYGALALGQDGSWTYTVNQASEPVQQLAAGEVVTESFVVDVTDANGATVSTTIEVDITGTNDAPIASSASPAAPATGEAPTLNGQVVATDVDAGDVLAYAVDGTGVGTYGQFTVNEATGAYEFTLDRNAPAVVALGAGERATEDFVVEVSDGKGGVATTTVTISVEGGNEAPVISQVIYDNSATVEDGTQTAYGRMQAADADGDTLSYGFENANSKYGSFSIDAATGDWVFTLDNTSEAVQSLAQGEIVTTSATATVTDIHGAVGTETVTITILGSNDAPVIERVVYDAGAIASDEVSTLTGAVLASDIDATDVLAFTIMGQGAGNYGTLSIDENGNWAYTGDAAKMAQLGTGETAIETFVVYASDGTGTFGTASTEITIEVQGANSDPVISDVYYYDTSVTEDAAQSTISGYVIASDADTSDTVSMSVIGDGVGRYGSLTMNSSGNWSYTLDNASDGVQSLGAGETAVDEFFFQASDGNGGVVSERIAIDVLGVNDAPVLAGVIYNNGGQLVEDEILEAAGQIDVSDVDARDTFLFNVQNDGAGAYGSLVVSQDGSFRYTLNNESAAVQGLNGGQTVSESFSVEISDGNGGTVTTQLDFSVSGADDRPMTVLNFEDLYAGGKSKLPAGYAGFTWDSNTWVVQGINYGAGWNKGTTSGKNAIFDAAGNGMSFTRGGDVFDFEQVNLAAATDMSATAVITGLLNGQIVGVQEIAISRTESTRVSLDDSIFDFVDEVRIDGAGPVVMDDFGFYL